MRRWFFRKDGYRDLWLLLITGLVLFVTITVYNNQQANTHALCSFKADLQKRVDSTVQFLQAHPNGIPGIPAATLRLTVKGQQATLKSLGPLVC